MPELLAGKPAGAVCSDGEKRASKGFWRLERIEVHTNADRFRLIVLTAVCAAAFLPSGCARAPAHFTNGPRMVVTLRFDGPVNPDYYYYFLLRNGGDADAMNGPIPVVAPPYGNGFATGLNSNGAGFTDFVLHNGTGYRLYHVLGGINGHLNEGAFLWRGQPIVIPTTDSHVLIFEIDLVNQLKPEDGEPQSFDILRARYLQIDVVATTTRPVNAQSHDDDKAVDAFGDQSVIGSGSFNTFLSVDTTQNRTYISQEQGIYEPQGDPYPDNRDPSIDLVSWRIEITGA